MRNKVGDEKYYIIISMILGLLVLTLSLYFIFNEYFTEDDLAWQQCRQSVVLRENLPEAKKLGISPISFKDDFPLKCKTEVVEISKEDLEKKKAGNIIGETLVGCWGLFGAGDFDIFPMASYGFDSYCVPCARIHLTEEAREYMAENTDVKIDIEESLNEIGSDKISYRAYLNGMGGQFAPFTFAYARDFDLSSDKFEVKEDKTTGIFKNRRTGEEEGGWWLLGSGPEVSKVYLPKYFEHERGDMLIMYGDIKAVDDKGIGTHIPYMFYFQIGQENPDPFKQIEKKAIDADSLKTIITSATSPVTNFWEPTMCNNWDGVPA
jgi:hypothetical protein